MAKSFSTTLVYLLICFSVLGQKMIDRSNYIHLNLTEQLPESSSLPVVKWYSPINSYTNSLEKDVGIRALVKSYLPLTQITLTIGDEEYNHVLSQKSIDLPADTRYYDIDQSIILPEGFNYVTITAKNNNGAKVSGKRRIMVGGNSPQKILSDRKDYALIFATNNYQNFNDLVNPIADSDSIARKLRLFYGFETEVIDNPTRDQIWDKIREYNEKIFGPYDQLLVLFAGHGTYDEVYKEGYYITTDSFKEDKSGNSYLSHIRLAKILDNNSCRRILLIMDSCYGGAIGEVASEEETVDKTPLSNEYELSEKALMVRKLSYKIRKYFTSGGKEYVSDGIPGKHSPFAAKFLEALETLGGSDGLLTISEMQVIMENLPQQPRFGEFGHNEVLGDFVFISKK